MTLAEIWLTFRSLSLDDKRMSVQALTAELGREEVASLIEIGGSYEIWSPYDAHEAAAGLLSLLNQKEPSA